MALAPSLDLLGGAVEGDHGLVKEALIGGVHAFQLGCEDGFHVFNGLQDALAAEVGFIAVAQFHGFKLAGGGARRHNGAAQCAAFQDYVSFHGGVAARVKNFAGADGNNLSHIIPRNTVLQPVISSWGRRSTARVSPAAL